MIDYSFFLSLYSLDEGVHVRPNGDESLNSQHRAAQAQKIEQTSVGEFSSALCASDCVKKLNLSKKKIHKWLDRMELSC